MSLLYIENAKLFLMQTAFSATIANRDDELLELLERLERFAHDAQLPSGMAFQLRLVTEEILTNQVKYAYPPGATGRVSVDITSSLGSLRLEFGDEGTPFDPLKAPPPNLSLAPQQRSGGGLGIHLVKSLAAAVEYRYADGRNILSVTLAPEEQ
jgi:anti-sigma regulatory factor (Ser/Thr protein kinase)